MVTFHRGLLTLRELKEVRGFWTRILPLLQRNHISDWSSLRETVEDWAYPSRFSNTVPQPSTDEMQSFAVRLITDICTIPNLPLGMVHWAKTTSKRLKNDLQVEVDPQFEMLFSTDEPDDWREEQAHRVEKAAMLASKWASQAPQVVIERLLDFERQAKHGANLAFDSLQIVTNEISKRVSDPVSWAYALTDANAPGLWTTPFLQTAAAQKKPGWDSLITSCLLNPALRGWAVDIVLTTDSAPDELLATTLLNLEGTEGWIRTASIKPGISEKCVRVLLKHQNKLVAAAAAIGEWHASPKGNVRASLESEWRDAVVKCVDDDYQLEEMLKADETLAFDWLKHRLESSDRLSLSREYHLPNIIETLTCDQRRTLLEIIPPRYGYEELVKLVVGGDLDMYRVLLEQGRLRDFHLAPLERSSTRGGQVETKTCLQRFGDAWVDKAKVAMDAGYTPGEVLAAIHSGGWGWSGNISNMWAGWMKQYAELEKSEDQRIREIGKLGNEFAKSNFDRERARERHEAVYGRA